LTGRVSLAGLEPIDDRALQLRGRSLDCPFRTKGRPLNPQTTLALRPNMTIGRRAQEYLLHSRFPPLRLIRGLARAYREQLRRDNHVLVLNRFAGLDRALGVATARLRPDDPLEQLWRLPASARPQPGRIR
jgi:hypothetical protein